MSVDSTTAVCPLFPAEDGGSIPTSTLHKKRGRKKKPTKQLRIPFSMEDFYIDPIPASVAQDVVLRHHYLHRIATCSHAFGLFSKDRLLSGVIMYGTPVNRSLLSGICGPEEAGNVIELVRLWVEDGTPKNSESFLIGRTIPHVKKEILVSYADPTAGHRGIVYQASNWLYTGLSTKGRNIRVDGIDCHQKSLYDTLGRAYKPIEGQDTLFGEMTLEPGHTWRRLNEKYGDLLIAEPKVRKHRYVYFNAGKKRKKELMAKLRYPVLPYPKLEK